MNFGNSKSQKLIAIVILVVIILVGVWLTFFHSKGFVKTTATIVEIELSDQADDGSITYEAVVEYTVNDVAYREKLDSSSSSYRVGKKLTVLYDPENPSVVHSESGLMGIFMMGLGGVVLVALIATELFGKKEN